MRRRRRWALAAPFLRQSPSPAPSGSVRRRPPAGCLAGPFTQQAASASIPVGLVGGGGAGGRESSQGTHSQPAGAGEQGVCEGGPDSTEGRRLDAGTGGAAPPSLASPPTRESLCQACRLLVYSGMVDTHTSLV